MMHHSRSIADDVVEDMEDGPIDAGTLAGEAVDRVLFENGEWALTDAGLEHKRTGYFIEREDMGKRRSDGLWAWPVHMLEKTWCTPQAFGEAFMRAVLAFGIEPGPDLKASFLAAGRAQAEQGSWERVAREFGLREAAADPIRLGDLAEVGVEICKRRRADSGPGAGARTVANQTGGPAEKLRRYG